MRKLTLGIALISLLSFLFVGCHSMRGRGLNTGNETFFDPDGFGSPFGGGGNFSTDDSGGGSGGGSSAQTPICTVGAPVFRRWGQAPGLAEAQPVFFFQVRANTPNGNVVAVNSDPPNLAGPHVVNNNTQAVDLMEVLLLPPPAAVQTYQVIFQVEFPNPSGGQNISTTCGSEQLDYNQLIASITEPRPGSGSGLPPHLPGFFPPLPKPSAPGEKPGPPRKLKLAGPTKIKTAVCEKYEVKLLDIKNRETKAIGPIHFRIEEQSDNPNAVGAFFSQPNCPGNSAITGPVTFAKGEGVKDIYYISGVAHKAKFKVSTVRHQNSGITLFSSTLDVIIEGNSAHDLTLGFHFEDWNDGDYNDAVFCAKGPVTAQGEFVLAHGAGDVQIEIPNRNGASACDHELRIEAFRRKADGSRETTPYITRTFLSKSPTAFFTIKVKNQDVIKVSFRTIRGGTCAGFTLNKGPNPGNYWTGKNKERVLLKNRCDRSKDS